MSHARAREAIEDADPAGSRPRRWKPSGAMRFSFWLHVAAAAGLAAVALHAIVTGSPAPTAAAPALPSLPSLPALPSLPSLPALPALPAWPTLLAWLIAAMLILDHVALTAAGLCPRCSVLGPNLTRLPEPARRQSLVSITIDDGPDPLVTPVVLDMLRDAQATASFFLIASKAEQHPALVARIVAEGHSVENHSWSHSHTFAFSGPARFRSEITRAQESLTRLAGTPPAFFRAPAGMRNPLLDPVLQRLGLPLTSWTRRGFDTVNGDPAKVLERLIGRQGRRLAAGDILLLHDGHGATAPDGRAVILSVLPQLLASCRRLHLRPVSLKRAMQA